MSKRIELSQTQQNKLNGWWQEIRASIIESQRASLGKNFEKYTYCGTVPYYGNQSPVTMLRNKSFIDVTETITGKKLKIKI